MMDYKELFNYCKDNCNRIITDKRQVLEDKSCNFCDVPYLIVLNEQNNKKQEQILNTKK